MRPDTGVVDALISTSATSPTMPSNYTKKRRIGSFLTDGSGHIITFTQFGDEFLWKTPVVDTNGTVTPSTSTQSLVTLSTPLGVDVYARLYIAANYVSSGGATQFYAPDMGAQGGNSWSSTGFGLNVVTGYRYMSAPADIRTNTSSQVAATNETAVNNTITVVTLGWRDRRGQDA
jgi:hypothetical protein